MAGAWVYSTGGTTYLKRLTLALVVILLLAAPLGALGGYLLGQRTAAGGANAASGGATMEAANALYNSGQYGIAAQAYQQLVDQGYGGRALLYNRGIAQLEAGDGPVQLMGPGHRLVDRNSIERRQNLSD